MQAGNFGDTSVISQVKMCPPSLALMHISQAEQLFFTYSRMSKITCVCLPERHLDILSVLTGHLDPVG